MRTRLSPGMPEPGVLELGILKKYMHTYTKPKERDITQGAYERGKRERMDVL